MDYSEIEDAVLAQLVAQNYADNVEVVLISETQAGYKDPIGGTVRITVGFNASEYGMLKSTGEMVAPEDITIAVAVQATKLRGEAGVYVYLDRVREALFGFRPDGGGVLRPGAVNFIEYKNSVFTYQVLFIIDQQRVQATPDDYEGGVFITQITVEHPYNGN